MHYISHSFLAGCCAAWAGIRGRGPDVPASRRRGDCGRRTARSISVRSHLPRDMLCSRQEDSLVAARPPHHLSMAHGGRGRRQRRNTPPAAPGPSRYRRGREQHQCRNRCNWRLRQCYTDVAVSLRRQAARHDSLRLSRCGHSGARGALLPLRAATSNGCARRSAAAAVHAGEAFGEGPAYACGIRAVQPLRVAHSVRSNGGARDRTYVLLLVIVVVVLCGRGRSRNRSRIWLLHSMRLSQLRMGRTQAREQHIRFIIRCFSAANRLNRSHDLRGNTGRHSCPLLCTRLPTGCSCPCSRWVRHFRQSLCGGSTSAYT
jgi:hypothetical protein